MAGGIFLALPYRPSENTTRTVVSTATGSPFSRNGRYRHCSTAAIAAPVNIAFPLSTRNSSMRPSFEIRAANSTVPEIPAVFAITGYTGGTFESSNPSVTPAETFTLVGVAAFTTGSCRSNTGIPVAPTTFPEDVAPKSISPTGSGGPPTSRIDPGGVLGTANVACCITSARTDPLVTGSLRRSTAATGPGGAGTAISRTRIRVGNPSGQSSGNITAPANTATFNPIATTTQRFTCPPRAPVESNVASSNIAPPLSD